MSSAERAQDKSNKTLQTWNKISPVYNLLCKQTTDPQPQLFELPQLLSQAAVNTNIHVTSWAQTPEICHICMFKWQSSDAVVCDWSVKQVILF